MPVIILLEKLFVFKNGWLLFFKEKNKRISLLPLTQNGNKNIYDMKKIFIINGGQNFAHSGGKFNQTVTDWTIEYLKSKNYEIKTTSIKEKIESARENPE